MKKLCIVGMAVRSELDVPWDDEDYDIWGVNVLHYKFPLDEYRFTAWFQLHDLETMKKMHPAHVEWMQDTAPCWNLPIYMQKKYPDIPTSEHFPREAIEKITQHGYYQTGSLSWMLAFAILEQYQHIELMGQNFTYGEPPAARPCIEYWAGVAEGRGAKVYVNEGSDLLQNLDLIPTERQYGYEPMLGYIHGL